MTCLTLLVFTDKVMVMEIGSRIRKIRTQQGRTIQEIADQCHCSKALISKIENGKVVPALATLSKISGTLGVKLSVLLEDGDVDEVAYTGDVSADPHVFIPTDKGYRIFPFAPHFINKKMQPVLIRSCKGEVKPHILTHDGEEFIIVIEGQVQITIGTIVYTLDKGESVYFESSYGHGVVPLSDQALYLDVMVE